jgi:hypothetical protein
MSELTQDVLGFAFVLVLPLILVAGGLVSLFAIGALFDALDHPEELRERIEGAFRRPPATARAPGRDHYYRPFWSSR